MWTVAIVVGVLYAMHAAAMDPFPLESVVAQARAFASQQPPPRPTGIGKHDYLVLIAGTVEAFLPFQNLDPGSLRYGKIIDPYAGMEIQYSTPCFANAATLLLKENFYNETFAACKRPAPLTPPPSLPPRISIMELHRSPQCC